MALITYYHYEVRNLFGKIEDSIYVPFENWSIEEWYKGATRWSGSDVIGRSVSDFVINRIDEDTYTEEYCEHDFNDDGVCTSCGYIKYRSPAYCDMVGCNFSDELI